jgi:hypothetical protein
MTGEPKGGEPAHSGDNAIKYDAAISFLARDEAIAAALHERLSDSLRVFFYPRNQEELAGTDGMESMREPFIRSRMMVVLYREPWGETKWTRVEATAIKERCFNEGWDPLFFITLGKTATLPKWLPPIYVRFNYADFGNEQAVGAIKSRLLELGGKISPPDAITQAKLVQAEARYRAERSALFRSEIWIKETVHRAARDICIEVERLCATINEETGAQIKAGARDMECAMTDGRVSIVAGWRGQIYANVIDENAHFAALEFAVQVAMPGKPILYTFGSPKVLRETLFHVELSRSRELRWVENKKSKALMTTAEVADRCVRLFLDLMHRANRGEIDLRQ